MGVAGGLDGRTWSPWPATAAAAQSAFNAVYGQVPGELAPKLALAVACEPGGEYDVAEGLYLTCARTDANYIAPAAFGLAAIRSDGATSTGAVPALDLVPPTSGRTPGLAGSEPGCWQDRAAGCLRWPRPWTASRA